jgi:hypothetical protein
MDKTKYQMIREILDLTDYKIKLGMFEEIEKVVVTEDRVTVLVAACKVKETFGQYTITHTGKRLISLVQVLEDGYEWWTIDELETWEQADLIYKRGTRVESPQERRERREWEGLCYRPGTSRTPLDNAESADTETMRKYWE